MVTFLHTADWQVGASSTLAGTSSRELRRNRLKVVRRIGREAAERRVDFMIVAGDMFEDHDVDDLLVREVVGVLNSIAPIPVFIIPGNHDFSGHDCVWERQSWKSVGGHVRLLAEHQEISVSDRTVLYPCPVSQKRSSIDPTAWIPVRGEGDLRLRIGIAHGSLDTVSGSANFPIASDRAEKAGLDYLALGDWHGMKIDGRTAYPGTPEPTNFGEERTGNVLIVDLKGMSMPEIEAVHVAETKWLDLNREIREASDAARLENDLKGSGNPNSCIFRVRTRMLIDDAQLLERLRILRHTLEEEALFLDWPEECMRPVALDASGIPAGFLSDAERLLVSAAQGTLTDGDGAGLRDYTAEEIAEARYLLRDYVRRTDR